MAAHQGLDRPQQPPTFGVARTFHQGVVEHPECCKRIYDFLCSMLVLQQLVYVLFTLHGIFMHFLELTY
jgi:hypothetical protein